ncbi:MAG TPA: hypothetical protein DCW83_00280 [Saprospirales bacterium]|jgi:hypothetical protein|nr:hypothetical protein [Saprospirales bacterium]
METAMWMIYSLFILSADANDRHVIEGTTFNSSEKCVQFTRTNIDFLSKGLIERLNRQYGIKKWKPLEIGCVEVGGNPNERIVLVLDKWKMLDGQIIIESEGQSL